MAKAREELKIGNGAGVEEDDGGGAGAEVAKTSLAKRRIIDSPLGRRRLQRQLSDHGFDL